MESYNRDFLLGENKYPKTPIDAYDLLKGWNKHQHPQGPTTVGLTFNNNEGEDGITLVNDGTKAKKKCSRCSRDNHKLANCYAKHHFDGTVLHVIGNVEEIKEIDEEVSSELSATFNTCWDRELEELMFIQPHMHSPEEKQSVNR